VEPWAHETSYPLGDSRGRKGVIDHIGIVVSDTDASLRYFRDELGLEVIRDDLADAPGVRLTYLGASDATIQLVSPTRPGPVAEFLERTGGGFHHVCFRVASVEAALQGLGQPHVPILEGGRSMKTCFLDGAPHGIRVELTEDWTR
jgi:methylmalonyl-CoA epimerase